MLEWRTPGFVIGMEHKEAAKKHPSRLQPVLPRPTTFTHIGSRVLDLTLSANKASLSLSVARDQDAPRSRESTGAFAEPSSAVRSMRAGVPSRLCGRSADIPALYHEPPIA